MWIFISSLLVYGLTAIVFAFREPPQAISSFYRVPAIFIFLPDRWVVPVGRLFLGVSCCGIALYLALVVLRYS
jgi:hypothetical protein